MPGPTDPAPRRAPARPRPTRTMAWLIASALAVPALLAVPLLSVHLPAAKAAFVIVALIALSAQVIAAYRDRESLAHSKAVGGPIDPWWALLPPVYLSRRGQSVAPVDDRPRSPLVFNVVVIPAALVVGAVLDLTLFAIALH